MEEFDIPEDLTHQQEFTVTEDHSAAHLGSGTVAVLSTPSMILFMEIVARNSLEKILPEGYSSVGIKVNVNHKKAVKVGEKVLSWVKVKQTDRKKISFKVKITYKGEIVGDGEHIRFIIDENKFLANL